MRANQATFPLAAMSRVLKVSLSGYYAWHRRTPCKRALDDEALLVQIEQIHANSRGTYGVPRIHAELREQGICVGAKRIARLMTRAGLRGVCRRRWMRTTVRSADARVAPDLVQREFSASGPDQLWVADATYVPTWAGFLYLAIVLDVFSRRIVGWSMGTSLRTELMLAALDMASTQRNARGVIHHSDQGTQYTSTEFGRRCKRLGIEPSMGSVGDAYDNAMAESFFATLECELIERSTFRSHAEAQVAIFEFIEGWYNRQRRHSSIGYLSPIQFERQYQLQSARPGPHLPTGAHAPVRGARRT